MVVDLDKLDADKREWLNDRALSRGTTPELEAMTLLDDAIRERKRRDELFLRADQTRIRIPGPPMTIEEIEEAINWGRA
jgi:hypothetical protein